MPTTITYIKLFQFFSSSLSSRRFKRSSMLSPIFPFLISRSLVLFLRLTVVILSSSIQPISLINPIYTCWLGSRLIQRPGFLEYRTATAALMRFLKYNPQYKPWYYTDEKTPYYQELAAYAYAAEGMLATTLGTLLSPMLNHNIITSSRIF